MIEGLTGQGFSEREACRVVGVNRSSYAYWRIHPPTDRQLRRAWLGPLVAQIHTASFGTYGFSGPEASLNGELLVVAESLVLVHELPRFYVGTVGIASGRSISG